MKSYQVMSQLSVAIFMVSRKHLVAQKLLMQYKTSQKKKHGHQYIFGHIFRDIFRREFTSNFTVFILYEFRKTLVVA